MSSVILTNWTVYYSSDVGASGGYKQVRWTGAGTPETSTNTVNELYSALMDLFSISTQNEANDTTPMKAITPTVYQTGAFDAGDLEPWFIDDESLKHLTGGSIQTVNWTRVQDSNAGIVKVPYTVGAGAQFVASDIGRAVVHASGDTGTLLWYDTTNSEAWIRPTDDTSTHNWDTGSGTFSATGGTGNVTQSATAETGERLWSNLYTIGTIESSSQIYVAQNFTVFTPWWSTGHIDRLFLVNDGFSTGLIDYGYLTVFAREWGYLFDHYEVDASAGGRNPIPLATSADINNTTAAGTIGALSGIVFSFGAASYDLGNGNGSQPYDVAIDCGGNSLDNFYEYTKYVTRRSYTTTLNGHQGQQYITTGSLRINFDTQTGNFTQGLTVSTSTGTGVIVASHDNGTTGTLIVRDVRGTFSDNQSLTDTSTGAALVNGTPVSTLVSKTAPFGTFAGGLFFGARGVYIYNMAGADANDYTLIDSDGDTQAPPATVAITVNGVESGDKISVFRATDTNGTIDRTYMTSHNTNNTFNSSTFEVNAIPTDTPSSGRLRIRNSAGTIEHHIRYTSRTSTVFTLRTAVTGTITAIDDVTGRTFYDTNANLSTVQPGDLIRNTSDGSPGSWAQIITITNTGGDDYTVTHTPLQSGTDNEWDVGDNYSIHTLPITYDNTYTAYVPYIDAIATGTSVSTSVTYSADRNISTQVRRKGIIPFTTNSVSLTSGGYTATAVRTTDSIVT